MKRKKKKRSARRKKVPRTKAYPVEFGLRIVRLFLEEGYSAALLCEQFGISAHSIRRWVVAYRQRGVEGLEPKPRSGGKNKVPSEICKQMVAAKKAHPEYGSRRISDVLKRFFLIGASPSTVHKTLSEKGLVTKTRVYPVTNLTDSLLFES